jgi:hypothetical protein
VSDRQRESEGRLDAGRVGTGAAGNAAESVLCSSTGRRKRVSIQRHR